jgi:ABC-2 type transport system ATP-binding protein
MTGQDYALAKWCALVAAMLVITLGPQLVLFGGKVFLSATPSAALKDEYRKLAPIVGGMFVTSCFIASIGLGIGSVSSRRAYATASIMAFFLLMPAASAIIRTAATGDVKRYAILADPMLLINGFAVVVRHRGQATFADWPGRSAGAGVLVRHPRGVRGRPGDSLAPISEERGMTAISDVVEPAAPVASAASLRPPRIELRNASRWYGNVVAVNDVSCSVGAGITGVLGPNGAGKSTVLSMISGLLAPSAGEVLIDGAPAAGRPEVYRTLALVPEREAVHAFLSRLRVRANERARCATRRRRWRDGAGASRFVDLESAQHRRIGTYSKGCGSASRSPVLIHDPQILLLDELFNGMDPRQRLQMMDVMRDLREGRVVVISSAHSRGAERSPATNVLVMVSGRLAASGHFREIRQLMTDRPHTFTIRSSDDRMLAAALLADRSVFSVELTAAGIVLRTADRGALTRHLPRTAKTAGIRLLEIRPTDESLESVFSYLVDR